MIKWSKKQASNNAKRKSSENSTGGITPKFLIRAVVFTLFPIIMVWSKCLIT